MVRSGPTVMGEGNEYVSICSGGVRVRGRLRGRWVSKLTSIYLTYLFPRPAF